MKEFWKNVWKFFKTPITTHISNFWDFLRDFFTSPSRPRLLSIIGIIIIVIALPITVIVLQKQTNIFQHAASTNLPPVYYECNQLSGDSSTPRNGIDKYTNPNPQQGGVYPNFQHCAWNQYCSPQNNAWVTTPASLCKDITGCRCNSGQVGVLGGAFSCNNGIINRVCGSYLYCNDTDPNKEAGLWPCSLNKPTPPPPPPSCSSLGGTCSYSGCANGTIRNGVCSSGYMQCCQPSSTNNPCASVPSSGNGYYCAYATANNFSTSNDHNMLYDCENGTVNQTWDCSKNNHGGCVINTGTYDTCKDGYPSNTSGTSGGSSGGDNGGSSGGTSGNTSGGSSCTTIKTYTECETGNATACLGTGSGPTHNVPKGHRAQVTQTTCGYKCQDIGTCITPTPSSVTTPSPSGSCTAQDTKVTFSMKLDGIGTGQFENNTPAHTTRTGAVRIFDPANASSNVNSSSQTFTFSTTDGKFTSAAIDLGTTALKCGTPYKVEVKLPGYLPATADITYGDTAQIITLEPTAGDINQVDSKGVIIGDGKIDINDYSLYRQCLNIDANTSIPFQSGSTTVNVKCSDLINFFDFQDGGTMESTLTAAGIGEWDANYNLWLRSYIQANGF